MPVFQGQPRAAIAPLTADNLLLIRQASQQASPAKGGGGVRAETSPAHLGGECSEPDGGSCESSHISQQTSRWSQFTSQSAMQRSLELQMWGPSTCKTGFGFGLGRSTGVLRTQSDMADVCEGEELDEAKENLINGVAQLD